MLVSSVCFVSLRFAPLRLASRLNLFPSRTMSFIDVILLVSLWKSRTPQPKQRRKDPSSVSCGKLGGGTGGGEDNLSGWATSGIAMLVAVVQLGVYNGMGRTPDGDMVGEVPGHFLEFSFEIISSLIAFWFCMDNKYVADKEIGLILYGADHDLDCQICEAKAGEFALEHSGAGVGVAAGTEECVPCTTQYQTV